MQGLNDSCTGYVGYRVYRVYMVCKAPLISSQKQPTHGSLKSMRLKVASV